MKSLKSILAIGIVLVAAMAISASVVAQDSPAHHNKPLQPDRYQLTVLGTLGGTRSVAYGINNRGQLVGFSLLTGGTAGYAVLWSNGDIIDLGSLEGGPLSSASTDPPNDSSEVAGMSNTQTPDPNGGNFCGFGTGLICLGFLWQDGIMMPMPTLGGNNSTATQINNRGQVVGVAETPTINSSCPSYLEAKPVIWQHGALEELPTIPGDTVGIGSAINDQGQIVGTTGGCIEQGPSSAFHAVLWPNGPSGGVIDLGNFGGTTQNVAFYINNQGQVVGLNRAEHTEGRAFVAGVPRHQTQVSKTIDW